MTLIKICGLKDVEAAQVAIDSHADLLGFIMVPNRARTIAVKDAQAIVRLAHRHQKISSTELYKQIDASNWTESVCHLIKRNGPFTVGVFRNQPVEEIIAAHKEIGFDFVQLHGNEPRKEYIKQLPVPVIARYTPDDPELGTVMDHEQVLSLFDSEAGGEGVVLDWDRLARWAKETGSKFILAGGLTPDNVTEVTALPGVMGVDVSGGVETNGVKDHEKIRKFTKDIY